MSAEPLPREPVDEKHYRMALAAVSAQGDRKEAMKILEEKLNKAKGELLKLSNSYDTALDDIQNHYMNASSTLTSIKEAAEKAVDAYMLEFQRRLRDQLEKMEELKKALSPVPNNKMIADSYSENAMTNIRNDNNVLSSVMEIHVETVPSIRFLGNEAFLFRVVNNKFLPYFGCITIDNKVLASDLHLHRDIDSETQEYTFRIDVPKEASDCKDLKSRIKFEVFQKDTGTSIFLSPVWVTDHYEVKFGFTKKTPFSVGVYLLDQHISGSPANIDPEKDLLDKETSDNQAMEVVKTSTKRRIGTEDPVVEAALGEINKNSYSNNGIIAEGVFKISKKTKIPSNPPSNNFLKDSSQTKVATKVVSGASCNTQTTQGRPGTQEGKSAGPTSFYQQIANIMMEKEGAGLAKMMKGKLNEPVSSLKVQPETGPAKMGKKEQGTHLFSGNKKIPCTRPVPDDKEMNGSGPVKKLGSEPCPGPVFQVNKELGAKKEQCSSRLWKEPVQTVVNEFEHHENSSKVICFPNRYMQHTYHPDVCCRHPNDLEESAQNGFPKILASLTKDHPKKFKDCSDDKTVIMKDLTVTITNDKTFPCKDKLKQEKSLSERTPVNFMVKTMSFNTVEGHLLFSTSITSPYALDRPIGIMEHSSGVILVSDTFNDRVLRLDENGGPINFAGPSMSFRRPSALVELKDGSIAVICFNFIAVFDAKGNYLKVLGKELLQKPYGLCLSEDGKLMTVETAYPGTLVIVTLCPELEYELSRVRVSLGLQPLQAELSKPRFMACYKDKVYVGDLGLNCVYEVNYTTGCLLNTFGSTGTSPGCMVDPSGITCDPDGNIYLADSRNHRIQVFDSCRRVICIIDVDYPLNRPSGIYLTRNENLFVLNYWANSLAKYRLKYKYI
ncbi:uncharacterized protein LOC126999233 isoform X2 [Eriocheir sinensis]|uniref:uncharacterized protein LOC126999233 isoform X2 n=1 Tax=Eriocheir sinensis TaxID=95602 RepID=UPI0021C6CB21|nr:uncharacterized protein LOC126999233 isoform X2 [Eriocheir sinensis]